jgi:hypothetical protein
MTKKTESEEKKSDRNMDTTLLGASEVLTLHLTREQVSETIGGIILLQQQMMDHPNWRHPKNQARYEFLDVLYKKLREYCFDARYHELSEQAEKEATL